jgi:Hypothetical protein (DUF2513)
MQRDLDLIRSILLEVEKWNEPRPLDLNDLGYEGKTRQEIAYQIYLLNNQRYIDARLIPDHMGIAFAGACILRMTMRGHDYLDAVRNPEIWKKTEASIKKVSSGVALDIVKDIANKIFAAILKAQVKAHTGLDLGD